MTIISGQKIAPEIREAIRKDVLALNKNTIQSKDAANYLNINNKGNKDGSYDKIDETVQNKIVEIKENKNYTKEQK